MKQKIATFGSHSALQILKGAKDEGFATICICVHGREKPYLSYKVADKIIMVHKFSDYFSVEEQLLREQAVLIPHASMIAYLGVDNIQKINVQYFGDKAILAIEADRKKQGDWLNKARLPIPKTFDSPDEIDRQCIIKFDGAAGGRGYLLVNSKKDFYEKMKGHGQRYMIQEYIHGVPVYIHYFYSPLTDEVEVMGFDRRYESNVDGLGRIPAFDQLSLSMTASYTVTGNMQIVVRESLLPMIFEMGRRVVDSAKMLTGKGLIGPFSLETVITNDLKIIVFEISARIVAGTNVAIQGSPYTFLRYAEPMSTGRRIAREIKMAFEQNKLDAVLG